MPGTISNLKKQVSKVVKLLFFPGRKTRLEKNIRRLRNFVFLVLLSILLWFITVRTGLDTSVRAPLLFLRPYWLVLLLWSVVLAYLSTKKLVELLRSEPSFKLFPEMDENWNFITKELADLGIELKDLPIILVLGHRPVESVHYFDHLQLRLRNLRMRNESETNFHVDLTESAIFVTCQSASLLGVLSRRVEQNAKPFTKPQLQAFRNESAQNRPIHVLGLSAGLEQSQESEKSKNGSLSPKSHDFGNSEANALAMPAEEIEVVSTKLKYLCHLISKARDPLCPINGVIIVVPRAITETNQLTSNAIEMTRIDLQSIRDETGMDLPYAVLATNIHEIEGFAELADKLDSSSKTRYLGLALHTRMDITTNLWMKQIRRGLRSFRRNILPALIARESLHTPPSALGPESASRGKYIHLNHKSYLYLQESGRLWQKLEHFCYRINQFQLEQKSVNPRFAGLFLTGLENAEFGPWLFIHEFVKHIVSQQNSISWTPEALARNRIQRRLATLILSLLLTVFGGFLLLLLWIYFR